MATIVVRVREAAAACLLPLALAACSGDSISPTDIGSALEPEAPAADVAVEDLVVASGYPYVIASGLQDGSRIYIDRTFTYEDVPLALVGQPYIRTRQGDRGSSQSPFLTFTVDQEAVVYIAYHGTSPPTWMANNGFTDTGLTLTLAKDVQRQTHHLYAKAFDAGTVVLGPNLGDGSEQGPNMYMVIVKSGLNTAPTVNPAGTYSGEAGVVMKFDGSASTDQDMDYPLRYSWTFGDGRTSTGPRPEHTYASPGTYTVRLTVTDARGATSTATTSAAVAVAPPFASSHVSAGEEFACALRATGVVECWGYGDYGEAPASKSASTGRFTQVHTHKNHACALRDDGVIECWGNQGNGRAPATKSADTGFFTQVGVGQLHSCALRSDGVVECWGGNGYGQAPPTREADSGYFTQLAMGDDHSCALRSDGAVECWGQLASTKSAATGTFTQITSGDDHTCGLRSDGVVECWFLNQFGQAPPTRHATTGRFVEVKAGGWHTCGLRSDGVVECWGGHGWGQAPAIQTASVGRYRTLDGGYYFNCAVRTDGAVECWGRNTDGQARSEQRIVFTSTPPAPAYVGGTYQVTADGGEASAHVRFTSRTPGVCTVSGWTVAPIAPGTCTVAANQAGGGRYFPAPEVMTNVSVVVPQTPSKPEGLVASASANVNLSWVDTSNNEDSFRLMRRTQGSGGSWGSWGWIASPSKNVTAHTDADVVSGGTYQYGVRACAGQSCTTWNFSDPVSVP